MAFDDVQAAVTAWINEDDDPGVRVQRINEVQKLLAELNPVKHPVANVQWVPVDEVSPNDYNPNSVAHREMHLLHVSIAADGYTQPVVTANSANNA